MKFPFLSIIIPVHNEEKNISKLYNEILEVLKNDFKGHDYEIILVNDGSIDGSWREMNGLEKNNKNSLVLVDMQRNYGQSIALDVGFRNVKGDIIFTLDGDGQNDPSDMKKLYDEMNNKGFDVVAGWRKKRRDKFSVRVITILGRFFRKIFINDYIHDSGCTLRIYKRKCVDELILWGEMHRYVVPILEIKGFNIGEVVVNHRKREWGKSKYSFMKSVKGFIDLLYVWFIAKYQSRPLHLFGGIGLFTFLIGLVGFFFSIYEKIFFHLSLNRNGFFLLGVFLIQTGLMIFIFGIVIDILVRLHYDNGNEKRYLVKEIVRNDE